MIAYDYPAITSGYNFNIFQRLEHDIGVVPISTSNIQIDGQLRLVLLFQEELDRTKKSILDYVMLSGNPTYPPPISGSETVYSVQDLYENRTILATKFGNRFGLYWDESIKGSNVWDRIQIYFDKGLTQGQRNSVSSNYAGLLSGVQ